MDDFCDFWEKVRQERLDAGCVELEAVGEVFLFDPKERVITYPLNCSIERSQKIYRYMQAEGFVCGTHNLELDPATGEQKCTQCGKIIQIVLGQDEDEGEEQ